MDLKTLKKVLGVGLLGAAAITNSTAQAAEATVQVDVNLPTVLVMYHYNTITLDLDQTALGGYLVGGTAGACLTGGDFCDDQGSPAAINVTTIGGTTTVNQAVTDPGLGATDTDVTLVDVVGVRALGCATYSASYDNGASSNGVTITDGTAVAGIDGQACSFGMTTGDLTFNLDFNAVDAGATQVSAIFDVTVTGV